MKRYLGMAAITTILAAGLLSACSGGGDGVAPANAVVVSDPYANCAQVTVGGVVAPAVAGTPGLYTTPATGPVVATGCVDATTGMDLMTLRSEGLFGDNAGGTKRTENVTPITTMVESAITYVGMTRADAKTFVTEVTGIPAADLRKDPVSNLGVQKAAAKLVAMVDVMRQVVSASTGAGNISDAATVRNEVMKTVVQEMKKVKDDVTVAAADKTIDKQVAANTFTTAVMNAVVNTVVVDTAKVAAAATVSAAAPNVADAGVNIVAAIADPAANASTVAAVVKIVNDTVATQVATGTTDTSASFTVGAIATEANQIGTITTIDPDVAPPVTGATGGTSGTF